MERVGARLFLHMTGTPTPDAYLLTAGAATVADPDETSVDMVLDCMELAPADFSPEEHHRTMRSFRGAFVRGPEYRIAVAGTKAYLESIAEPYIDVRSVLAPVPVSSLPELKLFESLAEAEAWLDSMQVSEGAEA